MQSFEEGGGRFSPLVFLHESGNTCDSLCFANVCIKLSHCSCHVMQ